LPSNWRRTVPVGVGETGVTATLAVTCVPCTAVVVERLAVTVLAMRLV